MLNDTIYAPSSAVGGAIAVIRVSGPEAFQAQRLFSRAICTDPGRLTHVSILDGEVLVDDAMAVAFIAPHSYTGEDMVEVNCHGGRRTVQRVLELLGALGFRPAQGGEFTRRAFENGKMDLSQAEAVMDVINASAEQGLRAAVRQLNGSVRREVGQVEETLFTALTAIDAAVDYPDEAEAGAAEQVPELLSQARRQLNRLILDGRRGRVLRDGLRIVLAGRPNVGKSSLMNALLGFERAIVTGTPGTTRDVLDEGTAMEGVPVRIIDTAGLRNAGDEAERIGVSRARQEMAQADALLLVLDGSLPLSKEDGRLLQETAGPNRIVVCNKCDLPLQLAPDCRCIRVSARTGEGLDTLKEAILALAAPERPEESVITNERHLNALERTLEGVLSAQAQPEMELAATDIRSALLCLGEITGSSVDEQVIDRIFSTFCVGK